MEKIGTSEQIKGTMIKTMVNLIELALSDDYMPLEFVIAARHVKGYDVEKAVHLENQYFDNKGCPITDEEYNHGQ